MADFRGTGTTEIAYTRAGVGYAAPLDGPQTGLMRTADDGRGTVLPFGYSRSKPAPDVYVRFTDCYAFDAHMNFGVTAPESIRAVRCIADAPELAEMRQRWMTLGVDLGDLRCFEITTNSTATEIRVFAKGFKVSDS